jgi:hypothetical protein
LYQFSNEKQLNRNHHAQHINSTLLTTVSFRLAISFSRDDVIKCFGDFSASAFRWMIGLRCDDRAGLWW